MLEIESNRTCCIAYQIQPYSSSLPSHSPNAFGILLVRPELRSLGILGLVLNHTPVVNQAKHEVTHIVVKEKIPCNRKHIAAIECEVAIELRKSRDEVACSDHPYEWHNNSAMDAMVHVMQNGVHTVRIVKSPREQSE